jgi:hypothetical protein
MYIRIYIHTYIHHIHTYIHTYVRIYIHIYIHTRARTHTHTPVPGLEPSCQTGPREFAGQPRRQWEEVGGGGRGR